MRPSHPLLDPARLEATLAAERAAYAHAHPRSQAAARQAEASLLFGLPLHWMRDWGLPFPLLIERAEGATVHTLDGQALDDFCLGDTAAMFGHAPPAVVAAVQRQIARGSTAMLPSEDAAAVGALLQARFGLPQWQFALSASDANRFLLRWLRAATGRRRLLVFDGCYHGTVDDCFVDLDDDGRPTMRPSLLGQVQDLRGSTTVLPFNDLDALEAALAEGDVACLLAEPALTNCGMVLPEPGFWPAARALLDRHEVPLIADETHTLSAGPGGWCRAQGLRPDALVVGKALGSGLPVAAYGFSARWAEAAMVAKLAAAPGHSGIGTTLSGHRAGLAAMRATLETLMTPAVYAGMLARGARLADGLERLIGIRGLPWSVSRLGARCELQYGPRPPRNGKEAAAQFDDRLDAWLHLALLNRGVLLTPFHSMMLISPATQDAQVDHLLDALDQALDTLAAA
ncbi:aminotransferase class III-fold pyridoxal phosphate-dependent enzyme [Piscinibacter sp. Jin2]|uniref:Aminotransferase class III-fold pyridoxal phosphate-dependent enzyme n=1 Tax=Aquariibacter lacus TaxID=2801332 RepID=A0A9X1BSD9_9BURK|nr:transaminase [Piscinibacter lacus]MBL0720904.1 aminotransferase class III-fold pyridoxal phosphate-dependent enzyme [Piscinibacter lacus]